MTPDQIPSSPHTLPDADRLARLAAVIDGAGVGVIDTVTGGAIVAANPAAERIFGYEAGALQGAQVSVLFTAGSWPEVSDVATRVRLGEAADVVRAKGLRRDGTVFDATMRLAAVRSADGGVIGVSGFVRDVTVEAEALRDLEASERRFRERYEDAPMPQAILDVEGCVTSANPAFRRLLGRDDVDGLSVLALRHPDDPASPAQWLGSLNARWKPGTTERLAMLPDGSKLPLLVHAAPLREADGTTSGVAIFVQDLTGLRKAEQAVDRAQARTRALGVSASDWSVILDAEGHMLYVSPSADAALGYDPDAIVGRSGFGYAHPDDLAMAQTAFAAALEHPGQRQTFLMRLRHADGSWLWTEQVLTNCLDNADIGGVVINARDVTARVVAENALRQSESRYRAIAETSHEGIWSVDPDGTTRYANSRMHEILGITAEDLVRRTAIELLSPEDRPFLTEKLRNRAVLGPEEYQLEYPHPDGRTRVLSLIVSPLADDAGVVGSLAMIADVTESRRTDEELRRRALHDDLTGLANRTLLTDRLEQAVARQQRLHSAPVAVLFVDLDQFKLVNDAWGYDAGDALLAQAGRRVAKAARPGDTVARFGGDEFVIVAEGLSESEARQLAECVLGELAAPFEIDGHRAYVNASIGVAVSPPASASELLRSAHGAMYDAKSRGRGRVHVFDPSLAAAGDGRLQLGSDLRDALSSDALELHYQPIVELATGRLLGVEALARWEHPVHGFVPPQKFVAVAEGIGLAGVLDRWVLGRAVRDQVRLRTAFGPDFQVSVNISARHLTELDLEQSVRDALAQAGSTAAGLVLELTESTVMDDPEQAREVLERITAMGIEIAVDDFGTGYSSLGYLSRLPVQALKIDRSFVADITRDADSLAIAAAVIDLARGLRLRTVAEGIETPEQLALLRALGCGGGQGYLWSPAVPLAQLEELVVGLPTRKFDVTAGDDAGGPTIRRDHITAEHGLTRLMALHREGASLTTIAAALNAEGFRTPRGLRWHKSTVARVVSGAAFPGLATAR